MLILDVTQAFESNKLPYVVVGGYALALHGIVRATVDVDLVVSLKEEHLVKAEALLNALALQSRIPVRAKDIAQFHEEYRKNRNMIAWSFVDFKDPSRQVDLLVYPPLGKLKVQTVSVYGKKLKVASIKSLLEMKKLANRPEDQLDIAKLEEAIENEKT